MSLSRLNNKGITMIEVLISVALLSIGIMGLMSTHGPGWRLASRSDYLGRAAGVLQRQLQSAEGLLINPATAFPLSQTTTVDNNVLASGAAQAQAKEPVFTVTTTTTPDPGGGFCTVSVKVTWPGYPKGISESIIVTKQESYRQ